MCWNNLQLVVALHITPASQSMPTDDNNCLSSYNILPGCRYTTQKSDYFNRSFPHDVSQCVIGRLFTNPIKYCCFLSKPPFRTLLETLFLNLLLHFTSMSPFTLKALFFRPNTQPDPATIKPEPLSWNIFLYTV